MNVVNISPSHEICMYWKCIHFFLSKLYLYENLLVVVTCNTLYKHGTHGTRTLLAKPLQLHDIFDGNFSSIQLKPFSTSTCSTCSTMKSLPLFPLFLSLSVCHLLSLLAESVILNAITLFLFIDNVVNRLKWLSRDQFKAGLFKCFVFSGNTYEN